MPEYKSRVEAGLFSQLGGGGDDMDVELLKNSSTAEDIVKLEQRWGSSWVTSLRTRRAFLYTLFERMMIDFLQ